MLGDVGRDTEAQLPETLECRAFSSELPGGQEEKVSYLALTGKEGKVATSLEYRAACCLGFREGSPLCAGQSESTGCCTRYACAVVSQRPVGGCGWGRGET